MVISVIMLNLCLDISFCERGPVSIKDRHTCTKSIRIFSFVFAFFLSFFFVFLFFVLFVCLFLMMILTLHGVCKDIWQTIFRRLLWKTVFLFLFYDDITWKEEGKKCY